MTPLKTTDQFRLIKAADVKEGMWVVMSPGAKELVSGIAEGASRLYFQFESVISLTYQPDSPILIVEPAE